MVIASLCSILRDHTIDARAQVMTFTIQILHASDLEGGLEDIENAPNFAAMVNAIEADAEMAYVPSILLSAGDNYIPGPFLNAGGDFGRSSLYEGIYNEHFGLIESAGDTDQRLVGTSRNDLLEGAVGNDTTPGLNGDDMIPYSADDDVIRAGRGDDIVRRFDDENDALTFVGVDTADLMVSNVSNGTLIIATGGTEGRVLLQGVFDFEFDTPLA